MSCTVVAFPKNLFREFHFCFSEDCGSEDTSSATSQLILNFPKFIVLAWLLGHFYVSFKKADFTLFCGLHCMSFCLLIIKK